MFSDFLARFIDGDWKAIVLKSYTAWAFYALAFLTIAPEAIYLAAEVDTNPAVWSSLQLWVILLGILGRVVLQPLSGALRRRLIVGLLLAGTLLAAVPALAQPSERATMRVLVPLVTKWEGEHRCKDDWSMHCAYQDIVGVWTVCFGETLGVKPGDRFSDRLCKLKLEHRLTYDFGVALDRYFTDETLNHRLTPYRYAAYRSHSYNVGVRGTGRSTATRRLNAGNIEGGCVALGWWNKAGGRVVRGLVNRRAEEVTLCLRDLK